MAGDGRPFLTLDDPTALDAARRDPVAFVRGLDHAVVDEVQRAPDVLLAIKRSVDADRRPGRFLLTAGRKYEAAVSAFSPYTETRAPDPGARDAARRIILEARRRLRQASYLFVNNRLEGNALNTIAAITSDLPPPPTA